MPPEPDSGPSGPPAPGEGPVPSARGGHSLLWRLFLANGAVLALVVLLLALTPIEITAPVVTLKQLLILLAGLAVMLAVTLVLLRRILAPLRRLTELMRTVDPDRPGRRLDDVGLGEAEVAELAGAFNEMLDRLEAERAAADGVADQSAELGEIADDIRSSLDEVRRIARELRPEALDDLGLVNALITLCSRAGAQGGVRVERELEPGLPRLDPDVELVVYRVAQEALTNVVRHAQAKRATVSFRAEDGDLVLRVGDDGRGLPPELPKGSAGIGGMRERARLVGGRLAIRSAPERGTEVRLEVPRVEEAR